MGYVPRKEYYKISPTVSYLFYPGAGKILTHGPSLGVFSYFTPKLKTTDRTVFFMYKFNFRNSATADVWVGDDWVQLLQPFDPTNTNKDTLARGSIHKWRSTGGDYGSPPQRLFTYAFSYRVDITFTNSLYFTSFVQYNEQVNNLNINTRLQWRFKPASDIYLVYTDNYIPSPWNVKNRAFVFKMNYWWNL